MTTKVVVVFDSELLSGRGHNPTTTIPPLVLERATTKTHTTRLDQVPPPMPLLLNRRANKWRRIRRVLIVVVVAQDVAVAMFSEDGRVNP